MSISLVKSRALLGISSPPVDVEIHIGNGLPAFNIVGLPEAEVRESRERVRAAIVHSGLEFPNRRLTVNLAPADLPKNSGRFDLPIAIGILAASGQLGGNHSEEAITNLEFVGELSLTGAIRPIAGLLAMAVASQRQSKRSLIVPKDNAAELAALLEPRALAAENLLEVVAHLLGQSSLERLAHYREARKAVSIHDFAQIKGLSLAKRSLEIAAAGSHGLIMIGHPGAGKSLLANALPSILPPLDEEQATEVMVLHDVKRGQIERHEQLSARASSNVLGSWGQRPFRNPHHSASSVALVGGGSPPKPGEVSLAHQGILFLDEFPEFNRHALEGLREPLECGQISISRAARQVVFPARFQLIAAMNPCPCGFFGDPRCRCTREQVIKYQGRVSGPLLDRIDVQVQVEAVSEEVLLDTNKEEPSSLIADRVAKAYERQTLRQGKPNALLQPDEIEQFCALALEAKTLLIRAAQRLQWSSRASHRVIKLARTIADLEAAAEITASHIAEAVSYRRGLINTSQ
jgi:magnesium chelatase family protein